MQSSLLSALGGPLEQLVDSLFDTPEERATAKIQLMSAEMQPIIKQLEVNAVEAAHKSIFVSGWRPFIGWACGAIFVYAFMLRDLIVQTYFLAGWGIPNLPSFDVSDIMPVLLGMLGLGGLRTFEKYRGVEGNR